MNWKDLNFYIQNIINETEINNGLAVDYIYIALNEQYYNETLNQCQNIYPNICIINNDKFEINAKLSIIKNNTKFKLKDREIKIIVIACEKSKHYTIQILTENERIIKNIIE